MIFINCASIAFATWLLCCGLGHCTPSDYFKICHRTDHDLTGCVSRSVEAILPRMTKGIPELGIPSIEPLRIDKIPFKSVSDKSGVSSNFSDILVYGAKDIELIEIVTKLSKHFLFTRIKLRIPKLRLDGFYEINSKILFLQLKGNGRAQVNATDILCDVSIKAHRIPRNGEEYLQFDKMTGSVSFKHGQANLQGLFKNEALSKATNDIINDNFRALFEDIKPSVLDSLFTIFTKIATSATEKYTLNELFPK